MSLPWFAYVGLGLSVTALLVTAIKYINWRLVGNRMLHWLAAWGVFLLADNLGVMNVIASVVRR